MKAISSYPFLLTLCMFLGPLLMISSSFWESSLLRWASPIVGALMVVFAFFYLAKRLHELMEEVVTLREPPNAIREKF